MYLNDWAGHGVSKLIEEFQIPNEAIEPYDVLLASYAYESYEGQVYVLLQHKQTRKLYEIEASHCSCYGIEGRFDPQEVTVNEIEHKIVNGSLYEQSGNAFKTELSKIVADLQSKKVDVSLHNKPKRRVILRQE